MHLVAVEPAASAEVIQLDDEGASLHGRPQLLDEAAAGGRGSAGGDEIVHEKHAIAGLEGIDVHLQLGAPVLQVVADALHVVGELARLAHGHEAYAQFPRGEDRKSTRLNSSHVKTSYAVFCLKK